MHFTYSEMEGVMKQLASFGAMLIVGVGLSTGCVGEDRPSPRELSQGVTVLEAGEASLSLAYKAGDVAIYLDARRGQLTAEPYQKDPDSPRYEIDARLLSDDGRIFWVLRGGDRFIDPTWADDLARQDDLPAPRVSNRVLFDMAADAVSSLDVEVAAQIGSDRAVALSHELRALYQIGSLAPSTYASMKTRADERRTQQGLPERAEVEYGSSAGPEPSDYSAGAGYYYVRQCDDYLGGDGWHTAIRLYKWTNSAWGNVADFANHGSYCYNGADSDCILQYTEAIVDYKPAWTSWTCDTPYNLKSGSGGHNCHDDTRLQMASFVYGNGHQKDPGTKYWCNGKDDSTDISSWFFGDQNGTSECNDTYDEGYRHPDMCRNQNACGGYNSAAGCYCDTACTDFNDCCLDGPC